jgi:acyl-CoA reductase-like NAD-dependent aldehyde dehydrogenase
MIELIPARSSYVAARWADSDTTFRVENPADETTVCELASVSLADVRLAIAEARRTFDEGVWADRPAAERARVLRAFLEHLETMREPLVASMVAEAGQPARFADLTQFRAGLDIGHATIDLYLSMPLEEANPVPLDELVRGRVALSVRRYEPIGVVAAITPYNAALLMALQKIIPALMAGNSVILRPSPLAPLSSLALGSAAEAAGLPAGALSILVEEGPAGAELITSDPAVDMVTFTGSTGVGARILAQAAPTVKRVALELGGKSAQIYLPDALDRVADGAAAVVAATAGQACVAATRMFVPQESKDDVLATVAATYGSLKVGPPTAAETVLGPLISAAQRARCEDFVTLAEENGGKVVAGGRRPAGFGRGYYFEPTVLDVLDNANPAAREEIFGPVLTVIGYRDIDHAIRMANDSPYGLSGQIYSADVATATAVARRLRTGAVNVNTSVYSAYAPGGGYKRSGLGRERGPDGVRAFQEVKHMAIGELAR